MSPRLTVGIHLYRNDLNFSAAQILSINGYLEPLSGHNYQLFREIKGELTAEGAIIDFRRVKKWLREIVTHMNHVTLVPLLHPDISVKQSTVEVEITAGSFSLILPTEHCLLLPTTNTTCEEIARYAAELLLHKAGEESRNWKYFKLGIDESPGQGAFIEWSLQETDGVLSV